MVLINHLNLILHEFKENQLILVYIKDVVSQLGLLKSKYSSNRTNQ